MIDHNGTQAAIRAGYSKKTANEQAARLLANVSVKARIKELEKAQNKRIEVTADNVINEFAKIAFSSISYLHNTWITRKDFEILQEENPDILDCIQEIKTRIRKITADGQETPIEIEEINIKLYDKQRALENLGKHLGIYDADNEQKNIIIIKGITFNE